MRPVRVISHVIMPTILPRPLFARKRRRLVLVSEPGSGHPPALRPEDLGDFFLARANAGDVEGLVALYEPDAVLAFPAGQLATGRDEIRKLYADLLASQPTFTSAGQRAAIRSGDLALTSTRLPGGGTTVEIARRQPDGTWLWAIDQPALLSV